MNVVLSKVEYIFRLEIYSDSGKLKPYNRFIFDFHATTKPPILPVFFVLRSFFLVKMRRVTIYQPVKFRTFSATLDIHTGWPWIDKVYGTVNYLL